MATKKKSAFESYRGLKKIQQVSLVLAAFAVLGVAFIGSYRYGASNAAKNSGRPSIVVNSLGFNAESARVNGGSSLTVTLLANSGSVPVNVVQASVSYDPELLQFMSMEEGGVFKQVAATDTATAGMIRVARSTGDGPVTGQNPVVKLNFAVKNGFNGASVLSIDPASSYLVEAASSSNILTSTSAMTLNVRGK